MNLENLKEAWNALNRENQEEISADSLTSRLKSPLEKIRSNMRQEFWMNIVSIIIIGFFIFWKPFMRLEFFEVALSIYVVAIFVTAYFYYRFYQFYRELGLMDRPAAQSISLLKLSMKYQIETYRVFNYLLVILLVPLVLIIFSYSLQLDPYFHILDKLKYYFVRITVMTVFVTLLVLELWIYFCYAIHIRKVDKLLNQLEQETELEI